ncbi:hypothetical protein JTE90_014506 [Oedothorax gibbosus]|uniref:Uncharacterized protein n=1 Tax=Oedothorax gibbosus TaxID=931172 RepID=A0AAV6VJJ0_9ARAC|nr:hypothetical protein JTE90_014506 [Oedothorax gibbosus]
MSFLHLLLGLFLNVWSSVASSSSCQFPDRKFNCNCILKPNDQTVSFKDEDHYNASAKNFVPAIQSLKYCSGSFLCKTEKAPLIPPINISNHLLCFSDVSCLLGEGLGCSCTHLRDLLVFNMTNDSSETGIYTCIKVASEGPKKPYCLKAACRGFTAIEKWCICPNNSANCTCTSNCDNILNSPYQTTYALFFSFGDIYKLKGSTYVHWMVVTALFVGLGFLLLTFCKLCERVVDTRRRSPSIKTTTVELHQVTHVPPPPTYEQVLKDKCVEFKKHVTRPERHQNTDDIE